jgi:hypothetical protein
MSLEILAWKSTLALRLALLLPLLPLPLLSLLAAALVVGA